MLYDKARILIALSVTLATEIVACAQQPFFMGLGDLPGGTFNSRAEDISADGAVVVGSSVSSSNQTELFRWTRETGMNGLGVRYNLAPRVSSDGSTVVSRIYPDGPIFRWTSDAGVVTLPFDQVSVSLGVSGDGAIVVGSALSTTTGRTQAARWTEVNGVEFLPFEGSVISAATDISANGLVTLFVAYPQGSAPLPFAWNAADGVVPINLPSPIDAGDEFFKISDKGKAAAGIMGRDTSNDRRGFRWTKEAGAIEIGRLRDGRWMSATGISADGLIIVGNSQGVPEPEKHAAIWDAVNGPRYLVDVFKELGLGNAISGWGQMQARGVSGDGRSIIGSGTNASGNSEAWIAYLGAPVPEPSAFALTMLLLAHVAARRNVYRANMKIKPPPMVV
jgi:probable HAF family extracellular repeat protein